MALPILLVLAACGGGTETVDAAPEPTPEDSDPAASTPDPAPGQLIEIPFPDDVLDGYDPEPTAPPISGGLDLDIPVPLDLDLVIPTPTPPPATPADPGTDRPLDDLVLDTGPPRDVPAFDFDEAAAVACAHVEFALDALVEQDADALADALGTAEEYARQSGSAEVSGYADTLAAAGGLDTAQPVVIGFLEICTRAGHQL